MKQGLTKNESRYIKTIYRKQNEESEKINTTGLAEIMGVKPSSVTEVLQNLADKELVKYETYHGFELSKKGVKKAKNILRKHRILEVLFVEYLGLDSRSACKEALNLDYHVSKDLVNSICRNLEHPKVCPCGKEISEGPYCREENKGG